MGVGVHVDRRATVDELLRKEKKVNFTLLRIFQLFLLFL